jgi:uncharacterized membrane protein YidH (DUF202 family)
MIAVIYDVIATHIGVFLIGVGVGLALASRYRITRARAPNTDRDGEEGPP